MRKAILVVALVAVLLVPVAARAISLPAALPDLCFFGGCVTWTHSALLTQFQQAMTQAQQYQAELQNLMRSQSLAQAVTTIQGVFSRVKGSSTPSVAAANSTMASSDQTERNADALAAAAASADGAQQQAIVSNGYAAAQLDAANRTNVQLGADAQQRALDAYEWSDTMTQAASGTGTSHSSI